MTFEEAVEILNRFRHDDHDKWYIRGDWAEQEQGDDYKGFTEFEAVAIAEKYLRDGGPASPKSVKL